MDKKESECWNDSSEAPYEDGKSPSESTEFLGEQISAKRRNILRKVFTLRLLFEAVLVMIFIFLFASGSVRPFDHNNGAPRYGPTCMALSPSDSNQQLTLRDLVPRKSVILVGIA